jgi:putative transposase
MGRKRYTPEQIIRLLRQSEVLSSEGRNLQEICREIGVTVNTYYRWRKEYGGMQVSYNKSFVSLNLLILVVFRLPEQPIPKYSES